MTKLCKKLIVTSLLAFCFAVCMCLFASCTDPNPEDNAVKYTVTVQTDATTAASGVGVQIRKGSARYDKKTTDENGKAEFELAPDSYEVELSALPAHYSVPEGASLSLTAENRDLTVTLEKNFAYVVKLVNPDGTPYYAEGVTVGVCTLTGNCLQPVMLEEGGVAMIEVDKGDYHVKVEGLPATAKIDCDADGYYTGEEFSETKTEMTITVEAVTVINVAANVMSESDKQAFAETNYGFNAQYVAYKVTEEIPANSVAYFAVVPELNGKFNVYANSAVTYTANTASGILINENTLKAGENFVITAKNEGASAATAQLVVTVPFSSYTEQEGKGGLLDVTVGKAGTQAVIAFTPTEAGTYKFTVEGDTLTAAEIAQYAPDEFMAVTPEDYVKNATATEIVHINALKTLYFSVTAKTAPATFKVKIEQAEESKDTYTYAEVKETLTQYTKPADKALYGVPMDGTAVLVYNETDKFYHLGTADGPVVVVNITKALDSDRFEAGSILAYMELTDSRLATYAIETFEAGAEIMSIVDYTLFLRGFTEYDYDKMGNPIIPENIATQKYYAKYVNEDGVYPLTQELKSFLENFYNANADAFLWQVALDADLECAWLFPCYYYDNVKEEGEADAIVGEYEFVQYIDSEGEVTNVNDAKPDWMGGGTYDKNYYKLEVDKNNKFTIYELFEEYDVNSAGSWSKDNGVYTFKVPFGAQDPDTYEMIDLVFTATFDSKTGELTLVGADGTVWKFKLNAQA